MAQGQEGPAAGEGRALSAALSAPAPFASRAGAMALHASDRHVDRWAPERDAVGRSRSLGTLSFVDRLITPWLTGAAQTQASQPRAAGAVASPDRSPWSSGVSWVFPRPWYQDELDWMAAAREGGEQSRSGLLTTQGTYARPDAMPRERPASSVMAMVGTGAQTVVAMADQLPRSSSMAMAAMASTFEYVAPSMAAAPHAGPSARAGIDVRSPGAAAPIVHTSAPAHRALRAWTPQVTFAAAQAAELMAGTVAIAEQAGLTTASRSPVLEGLAYVAPSELAASSEPTRGGVAPISGEAAAHVARSIAQLSAVQAVSRTATVEAARAAVAETSAPVRTASAHATAPTAASVAAASTVTESYRAEQDRVIETMRAATSAPAAESAETAAPTASTAGAGPTAATYEDLVRIAAGSPAAAQALRTVELVARSALTGSSAPTAGPRVALPAGLGGALAGHQAATATSQPMIAHAAERTELAAAPYATTGPLGRGRPFVSELVSPMAPTAPVTGRGFVPVWATPDAGPAALSAVSSDRPAAMGHLAWTDRWLARLAGASPASLSALDVASEHTVSIPRALAAGAPQMGYVLPSFGDEPSRAATPGPISRTVAIAPGARPVPAPTVVPSATEALRVDDNEPVSDEVFAAIARAARPRTAAHPPASETARPRLESIAPAQGPVAEAATPTARITVADQIARSTPIAPAAGLYAGLASSPMAPALAGILPLPSAPMFDPRAMFAGGLVSSYVGGAVSPAAFAPLAAAAAMAGWARSPAGFIGTEADVAASSDPTTVGLAARAPAPAWISPSIAADRDDVTSTPASAQPVPTRAPIAARGADAARFAADAAPLSAQRGAVPRDAEPMWSLPAPLFAAPQPMTPTTGAGTAAGFSLDAPLVDVSTAGWTARPGMTAELAQGFAVEHERNAADLSFDFVSPELVLAARVYGFGPAEAAQASRLAVAGPSGLAAMASALDLTFLRQLHIAAEHPGAAPGAEPGIQTSPPRRGQAASALGYDAGPVAAAGSVPLTAYPTAAQPQGQFQAPAMPMLQPAAAAQVPAGTVFGVERRLPRGSFLWPAGAVAALDLRANMPDGNATLPVAALELLAASAVAEMGSLVSPASEAGDDDQPASMMTSRATAMRSYAASGPAGWTGSDRSFAAPTADAPIAGAGSVGGFAEPAVDQVADAVSVPAAHRARFESVYLALSQSSQGQSLSPSVRAARALSIAARQDGAGAASTAQDRALAAWSVMPVVFSSPMATADGIESSEPAAMASGPAGSTRASRAGGATPMSMLAGDAGVEMRPGLSGLAARAGEAIGSFVHPSAHEVASASSGAVRPAAAAVERPSSAAIIQELVRGGGRSFSRTGGGEVEIPSWF